MRPPPSLPLEQKIPQGKLYSRLPRGKPTLHVPQVVESDLSHSRISPSIKWEFSPLETLKNLMLQNVLMYIWVKSMGGMVMVADPGSYGPLEKEALKIL